MPSSRIVYQNWIADLGRDPSTSINSDSSGCFAGDDRESDRSTVPDRLEYLQRSVRSALAALSEDERELIEQIHFMGRSCADIAARTGRSEHRLDALHGRALRKLRRQLTPLVCELFNIVPSKARACPICQSPQRQAIDLLIKERDRNRTWRPVMKRIEAETGLRIATPQTLIGHEKYH